MRILFLVSFSAAFLFLGAPPATAQNIVFNGDLETGAYTHGWIPTGDNEATVVGEFATIMNIPSLCLKRCPGTPSGNGGIEQQVHLLEGVTYEFSANIAAAESG